MENSIEETIKIIERKIKEAEHYTDITGLCLTLAKELCNAFINILSEYKRVLKENNRLEKQVEYDKTHIYTPQTIELNFISKSKIKAKIEQLKMNANYDWMYKYDYQDVVKILQELLEEGE